MVNTFEKQENRFDSRIHSPLRDLDIEVVYGCNLNCPQCCRLSGLRKGYLPVENIVEWVEPWSKRIRPRAFCISGGEPLLHPQLLEVIYEIRRMYPDLIITIFINGTLPHAEDFPRCHDLLQSISINLGFKLAILRVEVRRQMILPIHAYNYSKKSAD